MIKMRVSGSFNKTFQYFEKGKKISSRFRQICKEHGEQAVNALRDATPKESGHTASRWKYHVENWGLVITNDAEQDGVLIAVLLQYGHATKSGNFIQGQDFINPALRPIFDDIINKWTKEVQSL